jgi:membrane protease YdiL (CAAX protease family)
MVTFSDLLFVALFAVVGPLVDYCVFWPAYRRLAQADVAWARRWLWASTIANLWIVVSLGAALWMARDRSWASFGFSSPDGWRLWAAMALFGLLAAYHVLAVATLARSAEERARVQAQFGALTAVVPRTRPELAWWGGVSLSAGFCEEFLYRGYFVWAFTPWLGWWGAAALSLPFFALGHLYQGWKGVLRTGIVGALLTLVVAIFGSLWPAIALHVLIDLGAGSLAWVTLRQNVATDDRVNAEPPTAPPST